MTVQDMIHEAEKLSAEEREQLVQALVLMSDKSTSQHNRLSDLRGLGAEIWQDINVQDYINELRDDWD